MAKFKNCHPGLLDFALTQNSKQNLAFSENLGLIYDLDFIIICFTTLLILPFLFPTTFHFLNL